jgi:hypothetical protein
MKTWCKKRLREFPAECPEWTDHNPSDTGIILIELLAWLTEMALYQANQIPDQNIASFLSLLKGQKWDFDGKLSLVDRQLLLKNEIQKTLQELRQQYRAVTPSDFEQLVFAGLARIGAGEKPG